jgi:hypothetical protein
MADYELSAATEQELATYAEAIANKTDKGSTWHAGEQGFPIEGYLTEGTRFSIYYYKTKMEPTGNIITEEDGRQRPEMAPVPGVFAIMRWHSPKNHTPPPDPSGAVKIIDLPANSLYRFAD